MNNVLVARSLEHFLLEDIQHGDISAKTIFSHNELGKATIYAKEKGIFSGQDIIKTCYHLLDERSEVTMYVTDGEKISPMDKIATITSSMQALLSGERVMLNIIQRMSGIATMTKKAVETLQNNKIKITDTRKTMPGLRMFDKYAVRSGGGYNHRYGLYDGVMIKDNHIAFAGSIKKAVEKIRNELGPMVKIEVETESLEEVIEAVESNVSIIMFDNQKAETIAEWSRHVPAHILTEASGGITLETLASYRNSNVDFISLGFLTHSVSALDISLDVEGSK